MSDSRLLVTGLSGFVGTHLADEFAGAMGLSALDGRNVDLCNSADVLDSVARARPTAVIHLAGQTSVLSSLQNPAQTYQVNFEGTLNLLHALRDAGFRGRLLYVGSADAYGRVPEQELPVFESRPLRPLNPYSASKTAAEAICQQWSRLCGFEIVMVRPFNHIGPRQDPRFAVADFARQIVQARKGLREPKLLVGDIDTTRDFTDVRDIVRAYRGLLECGQNGEVYNICSGVERSLREIIHSLCEICGIHVTIEVAPERLRPVEQRRMRGSYSKLNAATGWMPSTPLDRTLKDILDYWEENT